MARVWFSGRLDADAKRAALSDLYARPSWQPGTAVIWDCQSVDEVVMLPGEPEELAHASAEGDRAGTDLFLCGSKTAALLGSLTAALERREGKQARVCLTLGDVLDALDLPELPPDLRGPGDDGAARRVA